MQVASSSAGIRDRLIAVIRRSAFARVCVPFRGLNVVGPGRFVTPFIVLVHADRAKGPVRRITYRLRKRTGKVHVPRAVLEVVVVGEVNVAKASGGLINGVMGRDEFERQVFGQLACLQRIRVIGIRRLRRVTHLRVTPLLPSVVPSYESSNSFRFQAYLCTMIRLRFNHYAGLAARVFVRRKRRRAKGRGEYFHARFPGIISFQLTTNRHLMYATCFDEGGLQTLRRISILVARAKDGSGVPYQVHPFRVSPGALRFYKEDRSHAVGLRHIILFSLQGASVCVARDARHNGQEVNLLRHPLIVRTSQRSVVTLTRSSQASASTILTM